MWSAVMITEKPGLMEAVRGRFAHVDTCPFEGPRIFFENAGGSYACRQVIDRLTRFYTERKVQPYGPYEASRLAGEPQARGEMLRMLSSDPL